MNNNQILLNEHKLNPLFTLKNKIIMAPMTRAQATDDLIPTQDMADYYAKRADAGLIITEGTVISPDALGCYRVPGIFNQTQIRHWAKVTDQVHQQNGLIFMQIWHVGRVSHPAFLGGKLPLAPSESVMTSRVYRTPDLTYGKSREASKTEIKDIIEAYAIAASNAMKAGFDGIEIHGANGYLVDQFLHHHTNQRQDEWGGSPENMARFAIEVVKACGEMIGFERVGLRLSPGGYVNEIVGNPEDAEAFRYLLTTLNQYPIAYLHTGNFNDNQTFAELGGLTMSNFLRRHYQGTLIGCGSYTVEAASKAISNQAFDLVALGRPFIANPDLIAKVHRHQELRSYDVSMLDTLN